MGRYAISMRMRFAMLALLALVCMSLTCHAIDLEEKQWPTPIGEDDEVEDFDHTGERHEMPADVFLSTDAEDDEEAKPAKAKPGATKPPLISRKSPNWLYHNMRS